VAKESENLLKARSLLKTWDMSQREEREMTLRQEAFLNLENLSEVISTGFAALAPSDPSIISKERKERLADDLSNMSRTYLRWVDIFLSNTEKLLNTRSKK
jgi:hypothetical protein